MSEHLYRGEIKCTICHQDPESIWNKGSSGLIKNEDGTYSGHCMDHRPEDYFKKLELNETCIHFEWRLVTKLTIHRLDPNSHDRRGTIVTIEMKKIQNVELAREAAVEALQGMLLVAHKDCVIHQFGERGEQHHCWIEPGYHWDVPMTCKVNHKYWGDKQIADFQDVCRLMARIHEWELIDETIDLLDRIVKALDDSESSGS